jgi:hypothetical protein
MRFHPPAPPNVAAESALSPPFRGMRITLVKTSGRRVAPAGRFAHFDARNDRRRRQIPLIAPPIQMTTTYPPPVDQLLTLGDPDSSSEWDYRALGIADEHVPTLLALLEDPRLSWLEWDEDEDQTPFWAPLHAWRALGQLGAPSAAEPLVRVLIRDDDDDWAGEEIPEVLATAGPGALAPVAAALPAAAQRPDPWMAGQLGEALVKIAAAHPETRGQAVEVLTRQLRLWPNQSEELNGFLIWNLADLKAVEAADEIREAYEAGAVDECLMGDWEDVQVELGLLPARTTPRPRYDHFARLRNLPRPRTARPRVPGSDSPAAKARQLRKAQKQAAKKKRRR